MTSSSCTVRQFQSLFLTISLLIGRQKLDIAGCPWPVLLCTYFCERQQTTADQSFDVLPQYVRGYNAVMIMLLTFVNLQWVTVEHHSIWFRAQKSLVQLPKQVEFPLGLSMLTCWMGELLQAHFLLTTLWFQNEKVKLLIDVTSPGKKNHRMRSFGVIWIKISYGTSKELMKHSGHGFFAFSMYHDPSDLWSLILIQITPKKRTLRVTCTLFKGQAGIELFFQPWLYKR